MDDEEIEIPSWSACQREAAAWSDFVKAEIRRAKEDIEAAEALIRTREDNLQVRGAVGTLMGVGLGLLGVVFPPAAIPLACAGAVVGADAPIRTLAWRRQRKRIDDAIKASKENITAWELELEAVEQLRRVIEQLAGEAARRQLKQPKQLSPPGDDPLKRVSEDARREAQPAKKEKDPVKGRRKPPK